MLGQLVLMAWAVVVLACFISGTNSLLGSLWTTFSTLGTGLLCAYAFWLTGFRLWRRVGGNASAAWDPLETSAIELGLGTLVFMIAVLCLGAVWLFEPWAAWALIAVSLLGRHTAFLRELGSRREILARERGGGFLVVLLLTSSTMTLVASLAPVTAQDALVYHLAIPAKYIAAGGLTRIEGNFFAAFPQNVEMLFTLGLLLRDDSLAQWFHWFLGVCTCLAVAGLARRIRPGASRLLAAAVFGTIPTVTLIAGWAYVDLAVAFFVVLSTGLFLRWLEEKSLSCLVVSALLAGAAAGCKYTGGFQGLVITLGVLCAGLRRREPVARVLGQAALSALVVALVACPWWIRNVIQTGNPLFPFCYGLFGGEGWDEERARVLALFLNQWGGQGIVELLLLPWRLTFSAQFFSEAHFDGMVGAAFLIAIPVVLWRAWHGPAVFRTVLLLSAAHALFWTLTTQQVRFLLPALALFSAVMGATTNPLVAGSPSWSPFRAAIVVACASNVVITALHFAQHNPLKVVLGLESRSAYLNREIPCGDYAVFEHIENALPESSWILFGSLGNPGFLSKRRYHADAIFENRTLAEILKKSATPEVSHSELRARGFTHVLFRFENVFDPTGARSEISIEDQLKLAEMLNRFARLDFNAGGTYLYDLGARGVISSPPR